MSYFKPYIDETGFHMPSYNDIKQHLLEEARRIYGQDIYLENDSQDYEFISVMADKIHDTFLTSQLAYNNRSPATAIGGALDGIVRLNGIKRKSATKSVCRVILTGEPGIEVIGGIIADRNNINWDLETPLTISSNGSTEALAICQRIGAVYAGAGQLNKIITPTNGWYGVTNLEPAVMGQEVESQEALRARQVISTAKPSKTVMEGIIGGIAEIADVTRYRLYENDTNTTDENTVPGHSICAVVEGGRAEEIANVLYLRKTPGCGTYGDVIIEIDTGTVYGMKKTTPIRFFRPQYTDIFVTATVKRLQGYVSQITEDVRINIVDYLNSLQIGENLTLSALWGAALRAMPNLTKPLFSIVSITAGGDEVDQNSFDIDIPFNHVTRGSIENVTIKFI